MKHKMKCGCVIAEPQGDDWQIFYCPLHAAAPEILEALKRIEKQLIERDKRAPSYIRAAIAKAEGE